jgi:hypothetical protein
VLLGREQRIGDDEESAPRGASRDDRGTRRSQLADRAPATLGHSSVVPALALALSLSLSLSLSFSASRPLSSGIKKRGAMRV